MVTWEGLGGLKLVSRFAVAEVEAAIEAASRTVDCYFFGVREHIRLEAAAPVLHIDCFCIHLAKVREEGEVHCHVSKALHLALAAAEVVQLGHWCS